MPLFLYGGPTCRDTAASTATSHPGSVPRAGAAPSITESPTIRTWLPSPGGTGEGAAGGTVGAGSVAGGSVTITAAVVGGSVVVAGAVVVVVVVVDVVVVVLVDVVVAERADVDVVAAATRSAAVSPWRIQPTPATTSATTAHTISHPRTRI